MVCGRQRRSVRLELMALDPEMFKLRRPKYRPKTCGRPDHYGREFRGLIRLRLPILEERCFSRSSEGHQPDTSHISRTLILIIRRCLVVSSSQVLPRPSLGMTRITGSCERTSEVGLPQSQ